MRRPLLAVVAALSVGAAAIVVPAAPTAAVDLPSVQAEHFEVLERIDQLDAQQGERRMGAVSGDPAAGWMEIGWVGDVPESVAAVADEARAEGIDVRFVDAPASAEAVAQVAESFAASLPADGAFGLQIGAGGVTVEVPTEAAAEEAGTDPIPLDDRPVRDAIAAAQDEAAALGVALEVEVVDEVPLSASATIDPVGRAPIQTGRTDDAALVSGGMRVLTQFRSGAFVSCTSGFTGVYGHRPFILTAAHCSDYLDDRAVRNYAGTRIGTSDFIAELNDGARATDLGAIALDYDVRTHPRYYTNQTASTAVTSALTTAPPSGYRLCSSGQVTGWKCDLTTGAPYVACYSSSGRTECMHVQLVTSSAGRAFCLGDSGGPVVSPPTSQGSIAVAVVSGIRGTPVNGCGPTGLIAPVSDLYSLIWGAQLHTLP